VTLLQGRNGLNAQRMAVLSTCHEPSLWVANGTVNLCAARGAIWPPILSATACHQGNYAARYSRCSHNKWM